jgi:hypothetical protein
MRLRCIVSSQVWHSRPRACRNDARAQRGARTCGKPARRWPRRRHHHGGHHVPVLRHSHLHRRDCWERQHSLPTSPSHSIVVYVVPSSLVDGDAVCEQTTAPSSLINSDVVVTHRPLLLTGDAVCERAVLCPASLTCCFGASRATDANTNYMYSRCFSHTLHFCTLYFSTY